MARENWRKREDNLLLELRQAWRPCDREKEVTLLKTLAELYADQCEHGLAQKTRDSLARVEQLNSLEVK